MAATHSLSLTAASSQYATINDASSPNIDITGSQTWECWFNNTTLSANLHLAGIRASGGGRLKGLYTTASGVVFVLSDLTTNDFVTASTILTNIWYHVAGVYNSSDSTIKIYLNGELYETKTASGTTATITAGFSIGRLGDQASSYYNGRIRNFRIWNVARTQQEIRDNMNVDTPVGTGLQGNWILNNSYTDSSANGYTLTASGSPTFSTTYPDAIDLFENQTFTKKHKITVQHTQVAGSSNLTDVPIVFTESNFLSDIFTNSQGSEINTNKLKTDSNLKAYYRMESGALTTDSSGNGYTLTNNNTVGETTGKFGGGADGGSSNTNKYLSIASDLGINGDSAITMSAWVKLSTEIASGQYGILVHGSTTTAARRLQLYYEYNGGTRRLVLENAGTTGTYNIALGTADWYYMVVTRASGVSGTANLYINGIKVISGTAKGTTSPSTAKFFMFADNSATIFLSGLIDDVSVLDRALSDEEIRSLYAGGQDLRFSSDIDGKTRLAHEIVSFDKGTSKAEVWVKANTLDYDDNTDIYVHYGNATASALDENEAFGKHQVYISTVELIQHLQSSSLDSTRASSDGTDASMTYTTGKIKSAGTFNGSSSKIDMPSLGGSINSYSIAFWVNLSATTGSILVGTFTTGGASPGVYFSYNHLTANQLTFVNYNGSNAVINGGALSTSTWYHIVGTRDSSGNGKLYINAGSPVTGTLQTVNLGENANSTGYFRPSPQLYLNGQLDEIQIFSRVLSADEITTLYNNQNSPSTFAIPSSLAGGSFLFNFV